MDSRVEQLFMHIDGDLDGEVSFDELVRLMALADGSSMATASITAEQLFSQASLGTSRPITLAGFKAIFKSQRVRCGRNVFDCGLPSG